MKRMLAALMLLAAAPVPVQLTIPPTAPPPLPLPDESMLALGSAAERMTVPVTIGARGPWPFIIDTGAERTVLSSELAGVLGLAAGPAVRVTALTGTSTVATVVVPGLRVSRIARDAVVAPSLLARNLGAQGMLGVDALQGHAVGIDFARHSMTLRPSVRRRTPTLARPGEIVVTARSMSGQLIVTNARWRDKRIAVVVDTGSPISIGNRALMATMARGSRPLGKLTVTSVTGQDLLTDAYVVDGVTIGGVSFNNVPIAFTDGAAFTRLGLGERPALLLGMDALRLFRQVDIDFSNREIRFTLPRGYAARGGVG